MNIINFVFALIISNVLCTAPTSDKLGTPQKVGTEAECGLRGQTPEDEEKLRKKLSAENYPSAEVPKAGDETKVEEAGKADPEKVNKDGSGEDDEGIESSQAVC